MHGHLMTGTCLRAVLAATVTALIFATGCGGTNQDPAPRETTSTEPQPILDSATKVMTDAGTGSYTVEVPGLTLVTEGEFDLNEPFTSQSMTTQPPDLPNGFTVRSLAYEKEFFANVSEGPIKKCWMRYEVSDLADAREAIGAGALASTDLVSPAASPAAEILRDPIGRDFVKDSPTKINADVNVQAAVAAAFPKAGNLLAENLDQEGLVAPVVLEVENGRYTGASYTLGVLFEAAEIDAADLKEAGLVDKTMTAMTPKQTLEFLSSLDVQIDYGSFGQKVELARPQPDEIIDVDFATLDENDSLICKAAG